jgi:hypothetical protein
MHGPYNVKIVAELMVREGFGDVVVKTRAFYV